jgi:hypothetical protein
MTKNVEKLNEIEVSVTSARDELEVWYLKDLFCTSLGSNGILEKMDTPSDEIYTRFIPNQEHVLYLTRNMFYT